MKIVRRKTDPSGKTERSWVEMEARGDLLVLKLPAGTPDAAVLAEAQRVLTVRRTERDAERQRQVREAATRGEELAGMTSAERLAAAQEIDAQIARLQAMKTALLEGG